MLFSHKSVDWASSAADPSLLKLSFFVGLTAVSLRFIVVIFRFKRICLPTAPLLQKETNQWVQ
jgi:hypothetical protein